jgi:hypothetical protein
MGIAVGLDHLVGRHEFDIPTDGQSPQQGRAQESVLDDPAHRRRRGLRIGRGFAVIEMQEQRAGAPVVARVGDPDVEDRLGVGGDIVPDAQRREQALTRIGDRGGATVEALVGHDVERRPVDQCGPEARRASREGKQAAVQAGTDNRQIEGLVFHPDENGRAGARAPVPGK